MVLAKESALHKQPSPLSPCESLLKDALECRLQHQLLRRFRKVYNITNGVQ
jgi:hypothetical protein